MSKKLLQNVLGRIEKVGNALPHPALLFVILCFAVVAVSAIVSRLGIVAVHPVKKEIIQATDLMSLHGLHLILTEMVKNFVGFAPLGTVLVAMLGFSIAERSGLLGVLLQSLVRRSPRFLLTPAILLAGILSHTAGDIGYVLLIPLAALAFQSAGLHPLAGLAVCFAAVSGGFAANLVLGAIDPLLAGVSQEAARILDPHYVVTPVANWYFLASSSFLIIGVGTLVTNKITLPFLGPYRGEAQSLSQDRLSPLERRGLSWSAIFTLIFAVFLIAGLVPGDGYLRDPQNNDVLQSPAMKGIVALLFLFGAGVGLAYGFGAKIFKNGNDVIEAMQSGMVSMAPYIVLVFFAAQFIALFNFSNVGLILAVKGAELLREWGLGPVPLMIGFILFTCLMDIFVGSASAKWVLMAPIFVPMFMLLGLPAETTQVAYRIADSVINIVSPLMPYFPLVLAFAAKYDPKAKLGTMIALMIPYSVSFLLAWCVMLFIWIGLGLPLGPGAALTYHLPAVSTGP